MDKKKMIMIVMAALIITSIVYAGIGVSMHAQVNVEEAKFHALQAEYFLKSKATRDGAATGSELNQDLVEIKNYPSELLRLKLVGVGRILAGIFISLIAILIALMTMPMRLGEIINKKQ